MFEAVKPFLLLILLLATEFAFTQDSLPAPVNKQDVPDSKPNTPRIVLAAGASVLGYGLGLAELSNAWYKNYPQTSFHFFISGSLSPLILITISRSAGRIAFI